MIKDIPQIGLGTWEVRKRKVLLPVIKAAIESGYKHIDTANFYLNEKDLGKVIKELEIDRNKLFITSKITPFDYSGKRTTKAVKRTLKELQINQIDLMLLHVPFVKNKMELVNAYKHLMKARDEKKVRHIGVSNFSVTDLELIKKETGEFPYINQIIVAPTVRRMEVEKFCKENNIKLTGYSTLRTYFNPNPFYPGSGMTTEQKAKIDAIGKKYNKNAGQVLSRWSIQNGYTVIPKSVKPERVKSNILINDFKLTDNEMKELNSWNTLKNDDQIVEKFNKQLGSFSAKIFKYIWRIIKN